MCDSTRYKNRNPCTHLQFIICHSTRVEKTILRYLQHSDTHQVPRSSLIINSLRDQHLAY